MEKEVIDVLKKKKLSIAEFERIAGLNPNSVHRLDTNTPRIDRVVLIAKTLGVSVDYLCGLTDSMYPSGQSELDKASSALDEHGQKMVDMVLAEETTRMEQEAKQKENVTQIEDYIVAKKTVRIFDTPVSAGAGMPFTNDMGRDVDVMLNSYTKSADYILRVSGSSMEPRFHDGDYVLVQETDDVDEGEVGIWNIAGLSYIKKKGDGVLISVNPKYRNIEPEEYDYQNCQGRVIGVLDPDWILS